jgi:hypothetical protein
LVWFNGAKTGKMILAKLGVTNLKVTPGLKPSHLPVSILGGAMGEFTPFFENSPLFFERKGENFT